MPWRDSQIETACQLGRGTAQRERRFPLTQTQETQSTESAFSSVECHVSNKWLMKWLPTVEQQHLHCVAYRRSPTVTFVRVVLLRLALASCPTQREQQTTHQWPLPRHIWTTDPIVDSMLSVSAQLPAFPARVASWNPRLQASQFSITVVVQRLLQMFPVSRSAMLSPVHAAEMAFVSHVLWPSFGSGGDRPPPDVGHAQWQS